MPPAPTRPPASPLVAAILILAAQSASADKKCERLGFHGARLNPCGFCVGGSTGLEPGHGRDCKGSCGGRARRDCHGVCGGSAYLDPCSGNCLCERSPPRVLVSACHGRGRRAPAPAGKLRFDAANQVAPKVPRRGASCPCGGAAWTQVASGAHASPMPPAPTRPPASPLVAAILILAAQSASADKKCERLGFHGARLNPCGFCVGGSTGLEPGHGRDCKGSCGGRARRDCHGVCGGSAYLDPCSGNCLYGKFSKVYGDTATSEEHRDCRGLCLAAQGGKSAYVSDACGVCVRGPAQKESPFKDCLGVCRLPGQHRERAELVCGTCVGGNGTVTRENVTDSCGRCKAAKTPCECDGQGERDVCGVCNGRGSSCFLLTGITPAVVPADVDVKITLLGAFSGETRDVLCVFRRRDAAVVGGSTEPTTVTAAGRGNGTSFTCLPRSFQQGTYLVTPRLSRLGKEVNNSNVILTVFNKDVGFDKMEPTTAPYRKEENKGDSLRLVFTGGDVPKFPLYCILQPTDRSQRPAVVIPSGPAPASHSQCHVPFHKTSGDFVVFPSLDGQHPLSRGFNLSLYATRPQIKAAYITGDGSSAVVLFDRPVSVCRLDECSAILAADTLNAIDGENSQCLWATKHQLIIQLGKSVAGTYLVTPRLSRLGKEVNNSNVILTVFNKDVGFDKMEPTTAPYRKEENKGDSLRLVFTGGDVPKFPLYCILQPTDRSQRPAVVIPSGPAPASHSQCHVPFHKTSGDFVVFPSLDGQHPLSRGFNLSLYATRPQIKAAYITGDGSSAVVLFDRPVSVCRLDECSAILAADTLNAIDGENSQCLWATKHQLIIQLGKSVAGEKLRLSLNSDMVTEDKQSVVMNIGEDLKVDARRVAPPNPGPLLAAISGPTVAPRCGRLELTVHYSWGAGPLEAFAWTATRNDSAPLEDHLKTLLKANSGPYLILEAEDLEMEMQYKFTVKVTADTRNTAEAAHLLTRRDVNAPIVVLYSDAILNQRPVSPEDELFLYAETVVPDCNGTLDDLELDWTVDDPRVRFDFGSQNSPVYRIAPYALPPDSNVTFQVRAFSYPTQWAYGESSVTLSVGSSDLKAVIKGGPSRMAGQGQNDVILNGSPSSGGQDPLVYQWSCLDEHLQPCYDYGPTATSDLLLKPLETNREVIRIMAERLEPGKSLNFTLEVFRTDNSSGEPGAKAATSTLVITQEEIIPLVSLEDVLVGNTPVYEYDETTSSYMVPAGPAIVVHALFQVHSKSVSINWSVPGFVCQYSTAGVKKGLEGHTYLTLPERSLVPHGTYSVHLKICEKNRCGNLTVSLYAKPGPTLCRVQFEADGAVEVFNVTRAVVRSCSVPTGSHPMTYQLFVGDELVPITTVQHSPLLEFIVPPTNFSKICAQVCDRSGQCSLLCNSSLVTVPPSNDTDNLQIVYKTASKRYREGRKLESVVALLSTLSDKTVEAPSLVLDQLLGATFQSTNMKHLQPGDISVVYQATKVLMDRGNVDIISGALEATSVISEVALRKKIPVSLETLEEVYLWTRNVSVRHPDNDQIRRNVDNAQKRIEEVTSSMLPKGQMVRFVSDQVTHIHHRFLNKDQVTIPSQTKPGVPDVVVTFHKNLRERFQMWRCGANKCQGVVLVVTVHQNNPFVESDVGTRMAPVVSLTFRTPYTGQEVKVKDVKEALSLQMRQTGNESKVPGKVLRCFRWNERDEEWTQRDMTMLGVKQKLVSCLATSTGSFTVFEVEDGLSTAAIAGIVVACLMSVFIIAAVMMFMVHKKQSTSSSKVADQAPQ
ncbi:uncharacterized protein ISCGN_030687 [Ixodes scapularis]